MSNTMSRTNTLLNRGLPKWPQMYVTGEALSPEQTKEVIRRTDSFFAGGFGRSAHAEALAKLLGMRFYVDLEGAELWPGRDFNWPARDRERARFLKEWGFVETEYVRNSWLVQHNYSPRGHGWCNPYGRIAYTENIGKWPSAEEVYEEWSAIAAAFPFLRLTATLMDREECQEDAQPVITFVVRAGEVQAHEGSLDHHREYQAAAQRTSRTGDLEDLDHRRHELRMDSSYTYDTVTDPAIPSHWLSEWASLAEKIILNVDAP